MLRVGVRGKKTVAVRSRRLTAIAAHSAAIAAAAAQDVVFVQRLVTEATQFVANLFQRIGCQEGGRLLNLRRGHRGRAGGRLAGDRGRISVRGGRGFTWKEIELN